MKQPELGKKLTELRRAKGLTQEEVVGRCNVSVRTIQRIENGEVVPRSYTVRMILSALGYNFDEIFAEESTDTENQSVEKPPSMISTDVESVTHGVSTRQLSVALTFGVIYFLLTFPEAFSEYKRFIDGTIIFGDKWYIVLKVTLLVSFIIFQMGFVLIGKLFNNYLLRIAAIIHIAFIAGLYVYDVASVNEPGDNKWAIVPAAMLYGAIGLLYGAALIQLREKLSTTAWLAGGLEILSACIFFTVALFPLADLIAMFAELLELVILYKVIDRLKNREFGWRSAQQG
jgi:transcriptional regulator with XRE-family HTH domain